MDDRRGNRRLNFERRISNQTKSKSTDGQTIERGQEMEEEWETDVQHAAHMTIMMIMRSRWRWECRRLKEYAVQFRKAGMQADSDRKVDVDEKERRRGRGECNSSIETDFIHPQFRRRSDLRIGESMATVREIIERGIFIKNSFTWKIQSILIGFYRYFEIKDCVDTFPLCRTFLKNYYLN